MLIIPAIDLKEGLCVRLLQGRKDDSTVYSTDPVATALRWQSYGAKLLHVVDLDGAFTGAQKNIESIVAIRKAVSMESRLAAGIRDLALSTIFSTRINRVILGTVAIEQRSSSKKRAHGIPPHSCRHRRQKRLCCG
jgi:phosphoribosylformimino-5-aminoimidazole carboxamide ribotide isomerase